MIQVSELRQMHQKAMVGVSGSQGTGVPAFTEHESRRIQRMSGIGACAVAGIPVSPAYRVRFRRVLILKAHASRQGVQGQRVTRWIMPWQWSSARTSACRGSLIRGNDGRNQTKWWHAVERNSDERLIHLHILSMNKQDFEQLRAKVNAMAGTKTVKKDSDGYYQVATDTTGNGSAILRFLPSFTDEEYPFVQIWNHAFQVEKAWFIDNVLPRTRWTAQWE